MATNPLSTTFGNVEGEGWLKFSVAAAASSVGMALPDQFNEECFCEVFIIQGTNATTSGGLFYVYNPGSTTVARVMRPQSVAATTPTAAIPGLAAALSSSAVSDNHTLSFHKDASSGKCQIRQTSGTGTAATVWIRKVG
jgi:hypothetical protein